MSENLPYHRKYRPSTLKGYIGNEKVKETVLKSLESDKRPQVILLWGASGCGKTSLARLIAKEYSCTNRDGVSGACGQCVSCQAIDDYIRTGDTSVLTNIQEIDITDQSGKKDLDSVLADMELPSFDNEWKVYIMDECHMASAGLQNRLLKIAEEPPEHVLMLLCTTNPEKLIETLKNRCQLQLHVTKPKLKELAGLLRYVCECEQIDYDLKGLEFVANRGSLTIRTALQNLAQVVMERNSAKYEDAIAVFESISTTVIIDFFRALKREDVFHYVTLLYEIRSKMDLLVFLEELRSFVTRGIYTINGIQQDGVSDNELVTYRELFGDLGVDKISYLLTKLQSLSSANLEVELLAMGYSGLRGTEEKKASGVLMPVENELAKELAIASTVLKEKEEKDFQQGIENAGNLMESASMDAILAMGGVLVE